MIVTAPSAQPQTDFVSRFFAPAFGAALRAAGLRALVPAARVRAVRVELGAAAPVLVPPARVGGAGVSVVVCAVSSW